MTPTRRELCLGLAAGLAVQASGQTSKPAPQHGTLLPSKVYPFDTLPVHGSASGSSRPVLDGLLHNGCHLEVHETELAPGGAPHPPHHHEHEEMFLIRTGTLEITIDGVSQRFGPGSVAFVASNAVHGVHNAGTDRAQYFVVAF